MPCLERENNTMSSAYIKWLTGNLCRIGGSVGPSLNFNERSLINKLNKVGLNGHPCLVPRVMITFSEKPLFSLYDLRTPYCNNNFI